MSLHTTKGPLTDTEKGQHHLIISIVLQGPFKKNHFKFEHRNHFTTKKKNNINKINTTNPEISINYFFWQLVKRHLSCKTKQHKSRFKGIDWFPPTDRNNKKHFTWKSHKGGNKKKKAHVLQLCFSGEIWSALLSPSPEEENLRHWDCSSWAQCLRPPSPSPVPEQVHTQEAVRKQHILYHKSKFI